MFFPFKSPIIISISNKTISGDPRCPVKTFNKYIKRRPAATLTPENRMYISSLHKITPDPPIISEWFSKQPMEKNKLGDLAKTLSEKGGLSGRKVNHSVDKTTLTSLLHSKVEATQIMQLTGHRNVESMNQISPASLKQQETMSNILTDISCRNRGVSSNGNISSTSKQEDLQVPVIAKPSFDDDFPPVYFKF